MSSTCGIRTLIEGIDRTFHVYEAYLRQAQKPKFMVPVLPIGSQWLCYTINSNLTPAEQTLPKLTTCIVELPRALNPFLTWDSFLVVARGHYLPDPELTRLLGRIGGPSRQAIHAALMACPVLQRRTRAAVLLHLDGRV